MRKTLPLMSLKRKSIERTISRLLFIAILMIVSIGCSPDSSKAQNAGNLKTPGVIEEVRGKYICPKTGLSIKESEEDGALCPEGQKVIKIVNLMVNAGWSRDEILSSMNIFVMGQSIRANVDTSGKPALGDPGAPVTIVEFTDMQCPYCKRYNDETFPALKAKYIDTGKVRYVQINLPLPFHQNANMAAQALYCASDQEKFWEMRDALFKNQTALTVPAIKEYASGLGIDPSVFSACLDGGKYEARVNGDLNAAQAAGISGTPGFVIARTGKDGKISGNKLSGAQPTDVFVQAIEKELAK